MLTRRLDIMISPEMEKMVKNSAKLQKITVGAIVREGIMKVVGNSSLEKRMQAFRELCNLKIKLPPDFAKSPRQEVEDD